MGDVYGVFLKACIVFVLLLIDKGSVLFKLIENTISVVSCINLNFHFKRKILCLQNLKNKLLCS